MNSRPRLFLVVEDHPEMAESNKEWLKRVDPSRHSHCTIVESPDQAIAQLSLELPDLAVVDLLYGNIRGTQSAEDGLQLLKHILAQYPLLNVLVYSSEYRRIDPLTHKIDAHGGGFAIANKLEQRHVFLERARIALAGGKYIPASLRAEMNARAEIQSKLTAQEIQILNLLCKEDLTDEAIAQHLHVSRRAAQNYVKALKEKLNVSVENRTANSRIALCRIATQMGIIS